MKKLITLTLVLYLLSFTNAFSQQKIYFWVEAGLKANYGAGMLINSAVLNDFNSDISLAQMYGGGGSLGINFGKSAIVFDGIYNFYNQKSSPYSESSESRVNKELRYRAIDIYGLYRYTVGFSYLELGVKYGLTSNFFTEEGTTEFASDEYYNDNILAPVLGIGFHIFGDDAFTTKFGFRVTYGIEDMVSPAGQDRQIFNSPIVADPYAATNPLFVEFVLDFNFGLGYYAKAACGKRPKFFSMD